MTGDIKYLRLQDVRKGMQFYEEDGGRAVLCEATEDAHEINENGKHGWQCIAKVISGDSAMVDEDGMVTLFECYNPGGYGLNLYQQIDASKPPATTVGETARTFPIASESGVKEAYPPRIPWSLAELAYSMYVQHGGHGQSLDRVAERGGFYPSEMDKFLPNWRNMSSDLTAAHLELARLKAEVAARYAVEEVMQQVQEAAKNLDAAPFTKAAFVKTIRERLANQRKEKS